MTGLALVLVVLSGAPDGGADAPTKVPDVLKSLSNFRGKQAHGEGTACASCHSTASWKDVRFNHERTGFPLTGKHAKTSCKSCHLVDFTTPLTRGCVGCHRDVHAGELGARCESCHDTADWRSRFDADAHRRTNFPLFGGHAALPCVECHREARERRFSRSTVECAECHAARDVPRTKLATLDHDPLVNPGLGGDRNCGQCHTPIRWSPAQYFDHESCMPVMSGPHAGQTCASCHQGPIVAGQLACETRNAVLCIECHQNGGSGVVGTTDALHQGVQLYSFAGNRCASCHKGVGVRR